MNREDLPAILSMILMLVMFFGLIGHANWSQELYLKKIEETKIFVENDMRDFVLLEGIIESPSVIIIINDYLDFKDKCIELKTIIYWRGSSFYVFNEQMTIAWKYTIEIESIGFLPPRYKWHNSGAKSP